MPYTSDSKTPKLEKEAALDQTGRHFNTTIFISKEGDGIDRWSVHGTEWIVWEQNKVYNIQTPNKQLTEKEAEQYHQNIHPTVRPYLNIYKKQPLELLYKLKSAEVNNELNIKGHSIYLYQIGGIPIGFGLVKGSAHQVKTDEMIHFIREKNKTYLNDKNITDEITRIKNRFSTAAITKDKNKILDNFLAFYTKEKSSVFSRSQLVEKWAKKYTEENKVNPFETLHVQRRTGCLRVFNPSETDSIKFFNKFLLGENVSKSLTAMIHLQDYKENALGKDLK